MAKELTHKQELACRKYIECGNKSKAYRFAYECSKMKPETINRAAYELFCNPNITTRIVELRNEMYIELNINTYTISKKFVEIRDKSMQAEPVKDSNGQPSGEYKYDANSAIKANIELGKIVGAYEKSSVQNSNVKVVFSLPDNGRDDLSNLSDKELIEYGKLLNKISSNIPMHLK